MTHNRIDTDSLFGPYGPPGVHIGSSMNSWWFIESLMGGKMWDYIRHEYERIRESSHTFCINVNINKKNV